MTTGDASKGKRVFNAFLKLHQLGITLTWAKSGLLMATKESVDPRTLAEVAQNQISLIEKEISTHPEWRRLSSAADEQGYDLVLHSMSRSGHLTVKPQDRRLKGKEQIGPTRIKL